MKLRKCIGSVILMITLTIIVNSCTTKKQAAQKDAPIAPHEQTAFYTLSVKKDSLKKVTEFKVVNVMLADTKINYKEDKAKTTEPYYLKIEISDAHSKTITAYTEHPLFKRFDLYSESGEITSKLISLSTGDVTFRVPYFDEYKTVTITETINFKSTDAVILKHEK